MHSQRRYSFSVTLVAESKNDIRMRPLPPPHECVKSSASSHPSPIIHHPPFSEHHIQPPPSLTVRTPYSLSPRCLHNDTARNRDAAAFEIAAVETAGLGCFDEGRDG